MSSKVKLQRITKETNIEIELNLDGSGESKIETKIGFLDHMLAQVARHGFLDLVLTANGDIHIDCHHTAEDVGIILGQALNQALKNKSGIARYGQAIVPMDESLILCSLDCSNRAYLNFDVNFTVPRIGELDSEMIEEFFRAVSVNAGLTLHFKQMSGKNNHHIAEGVFKSFGKALDMATKIEERASGVISTKGML